MTNNILKSQED